MCEVFCFRSFSKSAYQRPKWRIGRQMTHKGSFLWVQNRNHLKTLFLYPLCHFCVFSLDLLYVFFFGSSTSFGDLVETKTSQRTKFRSVISLTTTILHFIWMMYVPTIACIVLWMHFAHFLFHRRPTILRMKREWSTLTHSKLYFCDAFDGNL